VLTLPVAGSPTPPPATGYMVVVGTGKFYEVADISNNVQQSLYGLWDPVVTFGMTSPPTSAPTDGPTLRSNKR
jgi:Tfp pilus tip-associated adhesin PilY1